MIDIHCHILPSVDDGPASMEEALEMAAMAEKDGIQYIVATPHMCDETGISDQVIEKVKSVNACLREKGMTLRILPGSENCMFLEPETIRKHSINNTDYVLLEFPHTGIPANADRFLFNIIMAGSVPVIAHPERNVTILRNPETLRPFIRSGALAQVTAGSLTGEFGERVRECARYILKKGLAHILASDGHSCSHRLPLLSAGLREASSIIGDRAATQMVIQTPEKIVRGIPL